MGGWKRKGNGLDLILNGDNVKKAIKRFEEEAFYYPFILIIKFPISGNIKILRSK